MTNRSIRATSVVVAAVLACTGTPAAAETLRDRLSAGAARAGKAVKSTIDNVGESIDSTVDLAINDESPDELREELDVMADLALAQLTGQNPGVQDLLAQSAGYAVFDARSATLLSVTAGFGRGVAVSTVTDARTYMRMGKGGVGVSFGGFADASRIVILFETPEAFDRFVTEGFDASAEAGAQLGDKSAGEALRFTNGRSVFFLSNNGWKLSAAATGTKYWRDPYLN